MPPSKAVVVVLLVVLSGCSFPGDTGTEPTVPTRPTTTVEPTAATTVTDTATTTANESGELAPGITRDRLVNPVALTRAHQERLLADGYVLEQTIVSTYDGNVSNRFEVRTSSGPGGELVSQNGTSVGFDAEGNTSITRNRMWLNATTIVVRHVESGRATYRIRPRTYPAESLIWFRGL